MVCLQCLGYYIIISSTLFSNVNNCCAFLLPISSNDNYHQQILLTLSIVWIFIYCGNYFILCLFIYVVDLTGKQNIMTLESIICFCWTSYLSLSLWIITWNFNMPPFSHFNSRDREYCCIHLNRKMDFIVRIKKLENYENLDEWKNFKQKSYQNGSIVLSRSVTNCVGILKGITSNR